MYSLVFFMYCNPMFISRCTRVMSCLDVPIERFYNVNKSCQVILGNPPIVQGLNSPHSGALGLLESHRKVGPSESLSSRELV